jgi:hypothetical protein
MFGGYQVGGWLWDMKSRCINTYIYEVNIWYWIGIAKGWQEWGRYYGNDS